MVDQPTRTRSVARIAFLTLLLVTAFACARTDQLPAEEATVAPPGAAPSPRPVTLTPTVEVFHSDEAEFDAELGKPFGLAEGQTARIPSEGLAITSSRFIEDTRCPEDRECEWPGEVVVEYAVTKNERALGAFQTGSHGTGQVVDNWVISIWDPAATAAMVRPYVETMSRTTSVESPANCSPGAGRLSELISPVPTITETHVLGIYDTGRWPSVAKVYVDRENRPLILVLSTYRATAWRIHRAEGTIIDRIILNGYGQHQAVGVDDVITVNRSGESPEGYIVGSVHSWDSQDARTLVAGVADMTGQAITTFRGCYEASEFTIP